MKQYPYRKKGTRVDEGSETCGGRYVVTKSGSMPPRRPQNGCQNGQPMCSPSATCATQSHTWLGEISVPFA